MCRPKISVLIKRCLLFIIFLLPFIGLGQTTTYYKKIAENTNNKKLQLSALDTLLKRSFVENKDEFIQYSLQYIKLAENMDSIEPAAKKAMNLQYVLTNYGNDPQKAIVIINGVLARKYKIKDSFLLGGLYLKRGGANLKVDLKKAVEDYTLAIAHFAIKDSVHKADSYLFRGQANSDLGNFTKASEDFEKAYGLYEKLKDYDYMVFAQQGIINMFSRNGFYEKAKTERDALIEKMKTLELYSYLSTEYYNQSLDYRKSGEFEKEFNSLVLAELNLDPDSEDKTSFFDIHSRMVEYYCENKQVKEAKIHFDLLQDNYNEINGNIAIELSYLSAKAFYLKTIGKFDQALAAAQKKLDAAKKLGVEDEVLSSYSLLSEIHYSRGDYKKSIENTNAANNIKDSIYNRSSANFLAYYQTLYETEKKEKELVEKNTSISLLEKDNESFKKASLFAAIAILLAFGLILLFRNQQYLKTHKLLQERFSQKLLVSQEKERRRISKDLHDGVGQHLLVIKNKLISLGDESTKKLVDEAIDEVRSISRDLHPFQLQELGITRAIEYTIHQMDENTTLFFSSEIDNIDNIFSKEEEMNIYRIVQESLSNILKHAQAEASRVTVKKLTNLIQISIRDNGVGFDFNERYQDTKSLGLKTLLERTKFLKGQMKVTSKKDSGTTIEFQFPL